ncbi:MAG: PD40 domain-containing protein [Chloroflexi bacterium]|nr:PD40 domain-containing protein [Chloroflexota bacterium]
MEQESKAQFGCALATCLSMVVMLACAALVLSFGALTVPVTRVAAPSVPAVAASPAATKVDRIAVVGNEGNIYTMDRAGGDVVQVTNDVTPTARGMPIRRYMFPNWSPDSRQLAFVGVASDGSARILSTGPREARPRELFGSQDMVPIYMSWSPDSQRIAFLAQDDNRDISLGYVNGDGSGGGELGQGAPFYFSWAPDSGSLISHVGGSRRASADAFVGSHTFDGADPRDLNLAPSNFLAPAFSPDGREVLTAIMGATERDNALVASDLDGNNARTLAKFAGMLAFNWSPDGRQIAYLVTPNNRIGQNSQIHLVDADGRNDRVIAEDSPIAFFWSPDGTKLGYMAIARGNEGRLLPVSAPAQAATLRIEWKVYNVSDGSVLSLSRFTPSDDFGAIIPYSDQYGQSLRVWSPDSTALLYSARERDNTTAVYVVDVASGQARRIASGSMAAWSWQ